MPDNNYSSVGYPRPVGEENKLPQSAENEAVAALAARTAGVLIQQGPSGAPVDGPVGATVLALSLTEPATLEGTALTDASATIQPFTDVVSQYQDKATLTENRTTTLGVASASAGMILRIVRAANLEYTRTIVGTDTYTKYVFPSSSTKAIEATFQHNGAYWIFLGWRYVSGL